MNYKYDFIQKKKEKLQGLRNPGKVKSFKNNLYLCVF